MVVEQGRAGWFKIMSPFAAMRGWGAGLPMAYAVQEVKRVDGEDLDLHPALRGAHQQDPAFVSVEDFERIQADLLSIPGRETALRNARSAHAPSSKTRRRVS